jgi:polar amino acid transport system substrate-binding protein
MRSFLSSLFPVLVTVLLCGTVSARAEKPLLVTGNPQAPPIVWEKGGTLTGVGPEAATMILKKLNVPFELKNVGPWDQVQELARKGNVDLIVSAYKNSDRQKYLDFTVPYLKSPVVIAVKKGHKFPFTSWDALIGKKGVANVGESFGEEFDTFIKNKLDVTYIPYEKAFEMMNLDLADYLIIDLYPAVIYAKLLNVENNVEFLDNPATIQHFHMAVAKSSPAISLLPKINREIDRLKKQGYFIEQVKKQYTTWNTNFQRRKRFYARNKAREQEEQQEYSAGARDRGMENLARFIERDRYFMNGTNFME